jgi:CDP-ribitol ribitolphosphotransferase
MSVTRPTELGSNGAPEPDLVSVSWRRIQALVRLRTDDTLRPAELILRHRDSGSAMPVTGWDAEGGAGEVTALRFNVMQGPGQMPLDAGRWQLERADPDAGTSAAIALRPVSGAIELAAKTFELAEVDYTVEPVVTGERPVLALDVRVDPMEERAAAHAMEHPRSLQSRLGLTSARGFRAVFRIMRVLSRRSGRRVLFSSDRHGTLTGNLRLVHDRMVERGLDRTYQLQTLFKPGIATRRRIVDRLRLPWLLARADVIVIDDFQPVIRNLSARDARIVQLWHAVGAFKTVGYSRVGKPGAPGPYGSTHKNYSLAIVSSSKDVPVYAEAFGIPESRVVPTGIPRVDPMFDPAHRARALAQVRSQFPETSERFTILFAPTFRGNGARSASYDLDRIDYARLHALCVERDAVCLIRMHPFVRIPLRIPPALRDRLVDASSPAVEPNDLLFAVDLLVTDYSSIVFEYSTLGRPMLFYAYDLDEYVGSRDFYEPYESFVPGRIVRTFDELLDAIRREDYQLEKVEPFAHRHFDHLDGGSTDRVIDLITER